MFSHFPLKLGSFVAWRNNNISSILIFVQSVHIFLLIEVRKDHGRVRLNRLGKLECRSSLDPCWVAPHEDLRVELGNLLVIVVPCLTDPLVEDSLIDKATGYCLKLSKILQCLISLSHSSNLTLSLGCSRIIGILGQFSTNQIYHPPSFGASSTRLTAPSYGPRWPLLSRGSTKQNYKKISSIENEI